MADAQTVPLGNFEPMTDDEIDQFSQMSQADIELLRSTWLKYATPRYAELIDASQAETVLDAATRNG